MEHTQDLLPLNYTSERLELEDPTTLLSIRQPLSDLASNAQPHTLASTGLHYDYKDSQPAPERPLYSLPTVPSQPQRHDLAGTLELRRQNTRRRRQLKCGRNPIVDSPQYRAYRDRQTRDGGPNGDSKWPDVLEDAFLDALIEIPQMQRRKYSFHGKPHGRNELITEYLWIAYKQSLPPGAPVDEEMRRGRKQVSSHIQVLKGFLRDHPARSLLFPPAPKVAKNGFQDSFKDDPCLIALSKGRLPGRPPPSHHNNQIKPALFWLVLDVDDNNTGIDSYGCGEGVIHQFSKLSPQPKNRVSLESIRYWRDRYPLLQQLQARESISCPIIHMDVALDLLSSPPSQSSQLNSRTLISIPSTPSLTNCDWQVVTTLDKPAELCSDAIQSGRLKDPPINQAAFAAQIKEKTDSQIKLKVSFPAAQFAYVFACLVGIQQQYDEEMKARAFGRSADPSIRPAHEYVERISMFQELQSQSTHGAPFVTRAIFIWTFRQAREGETNHTTWGYLDPAPTPPRRTVMSPSPHPTHQVSAIMNENYNNWPEAPMMMQHTNVMDSYGPSLATPPQTAGLQSPFDSEGYSFSQQQYDIPSENLSFISTTTMDSESTLVGDDTVTNIESFLSEAHASLAEYDQNASNWQMPLSEGFDADPAWTNNYTVPATTPIIAWDTENKANLWPEPELQDAKQSDWSQETSLKHHEEWTSNTPTKHIEYVEQNIEQKYMQPWIQENREEILRNVHEFEPAPDARIVEQVERNMEMAMNGCDSIHIKHETMENYNMENHILNDHALDGNTLDGHDMVDHRKLTDWQTTTDNRFDYVRLTERLKA